MHSYSLSLKGNLRRAATGKASLRLQVIVNKEITDIPLQMRWPVTLIDNKAGCIKPESRSATHQKDWSDAIEIIDKHERKVKDIFKKYRELDQPLTKAIFEREYGRADRRKDFAVYMKSEIAERYEKDLISLQTKKNQLTTVKRLQEFQKVIPFYQVDKDFLERYAIFLKRKYKNGDNTVWGRLRDVLTYLHYAQDIDKIPVNDNFKHYSNVKGIARLNFIEEDELAKLHTLYNGGTLHPADKYVLGAALFACLTSLRISDIKRAHWDWFIDKNTLRFTPKKNLRNSKKIVTVPVSELAKRFIHNSSGPLFNLPSEQEMNRTLKVMAKLTGFPRRLNFHDCRDTFATHYYRRTKDLVALQRIMGHSQLKDTMKYVHINEQHFIESAGMFNEHMLDIFTNNRGRDFTAMINSLIQEQQGVHREIKRILLDLEDAGIEKKIPEVYLEVIKAGLVVYTVPSVS